MFTHTAFHSHIHTKQAHLVVWDMIPGVFEIDLSNYPLEVDDWVILICSQDQTPEPNWINDDWFDFFGSQPNIYTDVIFKKIDSSDLTAIKTNFGSTFDTATNVVTIIAVRNSLDTTPIDFDRYSNSPSPNSDLRSLSYLEDGPELLQVAFAAWDDILTTSATLSGTTDTGLEVLGYETNGVFNTGSSAILAAGRKPVTDWDFFDFDAYLTASAADYNVNWVFGFADAFYTSNFTVAHAFNSNSTSCPVPIQIEPYCLCVLIQKSENNSGVPANGVPTGFTEITNQSWSTLTDFRLNICYKVLDASDIKAFITGGVASGSEDNDRVGFFFKDFSKVKAVSAVNFEQYTTGIPADQTVSASGGTAPLIVFGISDKNYTSATSLSGSSAFDEVFYTEGFRVGYKIQTGTTSDFTVSEDEPAGDDDNWLASFYLEVE